MRRKLFPVTMVAVAVLIALGRCAPTVETPPQPPTPVPTPAVNQEQHYLDNGGTLAFYQTIDESEVEA